jgi:malate dehydrogenase (oxaloacetate-decarboxylating)(NADP+)
MASVAAMAPTTQTPDSAPRHLTTTSGDYSQSNSPAVRKYLGLYGLTPPNVESYEVQAQRCLRLLAMKPTPIEKFQYLVHLKATNVHLFYRLLSENIKEMTPLIYTPTVGEACVRWHEIWTQPEGMYLSYTDRGNLRQILDNWPHDVEITVLTDGSRILGLGDLGVNGMGIPVGKLSLYTACAGIRPDGTLPLTVDLGTNNEALREDPLYMGARVPKISPQEQQEFLDELMAALTDKWPSIVIQFEDFKDPFPALERYQNQYSMFNDDVQGTGAVIVGGFINAVKASGVPAKDHKAVFLGAGSAGTGVAMQLVEFFKKEGLTEEEARRKFYFFDSRGLVTKDRGDKLADHKQYFAREDNNGRQYQSLSRLIDYVQPTILMGLSTIGGAFTKEILQKMAKLNDRPVIFPLSNPSSKSECTFEEAVLNTEGRCLFASGSPFPSMEYDGRLLTPGQGNNMYVFPGIGLGAILSKSASVTQDMIYASASSLSTSLTKQEVADGWLYPDIRRIREVSVVVTRGVIRAAQQNGVDRAPELRELSDEQLDQYIRESMYDPFKEGEQLGHAVSQLVGASQTNGVNAITNGVAHL